MVNRSFFIEHYASGERDQFLLYQTIIKKTVKIHPIVDDAWESESVLVRQWDLIETLYKGNSWRNYEN